MILAIILILALFEPFVDRLNEAVMVHHELILLFFMHSFTWEMWLLVHSKRLAWLLTQHTMLARPVFLFLGLYPHPLNWWIILVVFFHGFFFTEGHWEGLLVIDWQKLVFVLILLVHAAGT